MDVDGDGEDDDDDAYEERTQDLAYDGGDTGPVATDEDPAGQRNEDHAQCRSDAAERDGDTGVFVQKGLPEREQPERQHTYNSEGMPI